MSKLGRYLNPSKAKLQAKGVDSVRSRVGNLREFNPELTIAMLKNSLRKAFSSVYELPVDEILPEQLDHAIISTLTEHNRSWEWNYGQKLPFSFEWENRFAWGGLQIQLQIESGIIQCAKVYSDAMDWELSPILESALIGCRFTFAELSQRLNDAGISTEFSEAFLAEIQ